MPEQKFEHESLQDIKSIQAFLDALVNSVDKKRLILSSEGQELVMEMKDLLKFSIKAKKKSGVNRLSIKITWSDASETRPAQNDSISISS